MRKLKTTKSKKKFSPLIVMALILLLVVSAAAAAKLLTNRQTATIAEVSSVAGSCKVNFSLNRPASPAPSLVATASASPLTPKPSATTSSTCDISFDLPDQAVCWKEPRTVDITYTVNSLPPGGPYYVITDWFNASPTVSENNYFLDDSMPLEIGKTYAMQAQWPGVPAGFTGIVEIHAGLQVVPNKYELLKPNCTGAIDYYWTPYVKCP